MSKVKLFFVFAIIFITATVHAQYTRDSAINLVLNNILVKDIGHVNLYASLDIK